MNPIISTIIFGAPVVGDASGVGAFSPSSLANVREWTLDGTPYYDAGSPLSNLPVLRSREPYGTYRAPRQGRYYVADGTDDYIAVASLTGIETVVSSGGTGTPSIASGRINLTSGTYWDIVLSNGSHYPCNEESGTTSYDIHANAAHGTITNATLGTFHGTGATRTENRNNVHGYRLSGSVYIPKRLTADLSADGNALTVTGQSPYPVATESPCVTGDGSAAYVDLGSALIPATADFELSMWLYAVAGGEYGRVLSQTAGAAGGFEIVMDVTSANLVLFINHDLSTLSVVLAMSANTWNKVVISRSGDVWSMSANGGSPVSKTLGYTVTQAVSMWLLRYRAGNNFSSSRIADLRITTGGVTTYFPLQDGPGSSNTNRNLAWYKSDGTYGVISNAIVSGTVANIWANRCPNVEDHSIKYGGRLGAGGQFILGVPDTALCADGNTKTLSAGKHGNPYSRLNLNPFTAAELNGRSLPTALAPAGSLASVTPADSAFMRSDTDGDDRLIVTAAALTGAELDNMETYIGLVRLVDDDGDFIIDDDTDFLVGA